MKNSAGHCRFPTGPDAACGAPVPPRTGPGRPAAYCADPGHNPVRAHRAARRYAAEVETARGQADVGRLAVELERARALVVEAERSRHRAEVDAHAARRERDAALALRDLAIEEAAEARTAAAETVSRMRREVDRRLPRSAAGADVEMARAQAHTLGDRRPRLTA